MEGKVSDEAPETVLRDGLFRDQLALITGGGTGIGLATARLMGRLGAKVILAARDEGRLVQAAETLRGEGVEAHAIPLNIRDEAQVEKVFDRVAEEHGLPDALVNNAGGQFVAASVDISANGFRAVVDLNLNGTWHMSRAYGSRLIAAGRAGRIVNIVIAPGTIETEGLVQYGMEAMEKYVSVLPIARMGAPQEVADLVAYLCSPAASYITGALVPLDGGEHLNGASLQ
jgi:NAD(P)-dependent dehydrogenase (short-subunit alcohol dehydrogenase family)